MKRRVQATERILERLGRDKLDFDAVRGRMAALLSDGVGVNPDNTVDLEH